MSILSTVSGIKTKRPRTGYPRIFARNPGPAFLADSCSYFFPIVKEPGGKIRSAIKRKTCQHLSRGRPGALLPGQTRLSPRPLDPENHPSPLSSLLRKVNCPLSCPRFSSTSERIRRPCGEFELLRRRQPERNRIRRTIPHRAAPGPDPARNRWSHEVRNPRPASLPRRREHPKQTTLELKR